MNVIEINYLRELEKRRYELLQEMFYLFVDINISSTEAEDRLVDIIAEIENVDLELTEYSELHKIDYNTYVEIEVL